ncbi:MAG: replication initiation factor domain-containing protein [Rhodospirillales bacterium]|nr:replication initiation factor domain-containing protein [Rhodospirillales bacterium]
MTSKGEKLETEFCIDWLHLNEPFKPYALLGSFIHPLENFNRMTPHTARYGYAEGAINQAGAIVMRNINRSDMGVHIGYSGKTLNTYRDNGVSSLDVLRWHMQRGASASRIDLAFDVRGTPLSPQTLYEHLINGRATTTAKTYNLIAGNDGGCTCYIGSRQSEAFVRIYDKGVESGEGGQWIRCDLELKASKARFAAFTMASEPDESAYKWAQGWLQGYVAFPDKTWQAFITQEAVPLARANKPEPDTRQWLIGQVAPAMARYIDRTGDYKLLDDFMRVLSALGGTRDKI